MPASRHSDRGIETSDPTGLAKSSLPSGANAKGWVARPCAIAAERAQREEAVLHRPQSSNARVRGYSDDAAERDAGCPDGDSSSDGVSGCWRSRGCRPGWSRRRSCGSERNPGRRRSPGCGSRRCRRWRPRSCRSRRAACRSRSGAGGCGGWATAAARGWRGLCSAPSRWRHRWWRDCSDRSRSRSTRWCSACRCGSRGHWLVRRG